MRTRVFVFEDNETLRSMICTLLESRGYEVRPFSDPSLCPMYLDRNCPCPHSDACADAIITDVNMPNVTGLELLENLNQNGCKVKCRAVMSGGWTDKDLDEARRLGCRIFEKPFRLDEILEWLNDCEKAIDSKRKLTELSKLNLERPPKETDGRPSPSRG
jgi:CheY-like chemotaxis protein